MLKVPKYKDITLLFSVFNTILTLGTLKPTFTTSAPTFTTSAPTFSTPTPTFITSAPTLAKFVTISSRIMMTSTEL